jgi:hypothetical protein
MRLEPHSARYRLLDPTGRAAGSENLRVERTTDGWHLGSTLTTTYPATVEVELDWQLDRGLVTRLLYIHSRDSWGEEYELEVAVTGNGLLAHRRAPDGPTQVELGWGPNAELDYISAAFAVVIMARSFPGNGVGHGLHSAGAERAIDAVEFGVEDLVPGVVARRLRRIDPEGPDGVAARSVTVATGHAATIEVAHSGALVRYEGLLELARPDREPTK